jgi:NADPH-dependent curcumin reductase CurA
VSAAAGSVGSAAVQMAKINGAHVVGIAGGPDKCRWVVETLGADACVDYKAADFAEKLKAALPNGADRYLDMVGGVVFDTALRNMAFKGEIGTIGAVSTYNGHAVPFHNMLEFPLRRLTMHGE